MTLARLLALAFLTTIGCSKPDAPAETSAPTAPSASASASASPPPSPTPPAPSASGAFAPSAATKDAVVSVFDPAKEPARTVKALAGGTVALYLPEWAGTSWKIAQPDKALGKPKEETIPGFAGPSTPAHAFTWTISDSLKGQVHKVTVTNTAKGRAPASDTSFSLTIDVGCTFARSRPSVHGWSTCSSRRGRSGSR